MNLATNPRRRLFTGFSSENFYSSTSSSSVFRSSGSNRPSTSSGGMLEDDDIVDLLESESLKIGKAMDDVQRSLERIKEKLGQGFSL